MSPKQDSIEHAGGVPNITFDLIAMLHNKLEAIYGLETYKKDAQIAGLNHVHEFLQQCQDADRRVVEHLRAMVANQLISGLEEHHGFGDDDTMPIPGRAQSRETRSTRERDRSDESALVGEASRESFPASDPPAFTTGRKHTTES